MSSVLETIFLIAGGLGLFLFGMKIMSSGIELVAGDRLQNILKKATSNRVLAAVVGIIATVAINSSTAVTIMTVSFVNSGLMNLKQAIGIIMGANVGTTFSAQLIAFRIDTVAPLFIFVGIIMHLMFKKRSVKNIGYIILGFGVLFFGVTVMGTPLRAFADNPYFNVLLTTFENPILALLAGFIFTAVVQSSSATMGLLVTMHLNDVPIPFETSAFIVLGTNIGTSITTVIASIPANRESKRAALFHIMFDIIGSAVFGTLIFNFPFILHWFQETWIDSARQVAMFHTLYNFATLFLLLPFVSYVALLMMKIVPVGSNESNNVYERRLIYLDSNIEQPPTVRATYAQLEVCRMGKIASENLALAMDSFFAKDVEKANKVIDNEAVVNFLNHNIAEQLVWINNMALSPIEAAKIGRMFRILSDIERIGDHAKNIAEYTIVVEENDLKFTDTAINELKLLGELTLNLVNEALDVYEKNDESRLPNIVTMEEAVDEHSKQFTENHLNRLITETCEPKSGAVFSDMIVDLERSGDHGENIALVLMPENMRL